MIDEVRRNRLSKLLLHKSRVGNRSWAGLWTRVVQVSVAIQTLPFGGQPQKPSSSMQSKRL